MRTNGTGGLRRPDAARRQIEAHALRGVRQHSEQCFGHGLAAQFSGTVPLAQLPGAVVTNNATSVTMSDENVTGNLYLPTTTASVVTIYSGGVPFIHAYGTGDFFAGAGAGNFTTTGQNDNTAVGYQALHLVANGNQNTAVGYEALMSNLAGSDNTAVGFYALENSTGNYNTALGWEAMLNNSSAYNTAVGYGTQAASASGGFNTAVGSSALAGNTAGIENTANGFSALLANGTGSFNTANGSRALIDNGVGSYNTANGASAIYNNTSGSNNTANGYSSLESTAAVITTRPTVTRLFSTTKAAATMWPTKPWHFPPYQHNVQLQHRAGLCGGLQYLEQFQH